MKKRFFVMGSFVLLIAIIGIGCINPTSPPVQTPAPTSSSTETPEANSILETPTPTPINEIGELEKAILFQLPKERNSSIGIGYGLELTFNMNLDLESINSEDATQYINIYCNRMRVRSWNGTVYLNPEEPNKLIVIFGEDTNITCDPINMEVVPIKGTLKVDGEGYIKGIEKNMEELSDNEDPQTHGRACVKLGECPAGFSQNGTFWHMAGHQGQNGQPTPTHTPMYVPTEGQNEEPMATCTPMPTPTQGEPSSTPTEAPPVGYIPLM